jgi:hypothetical protein
MFVRFRVDYAEGTSDLAQGRYVMLAFEEDRAEH